MERVESIIQNEVRVLMEEIDKACGEPIDIHSKLFNCMMSILCGIIADRTFPSDDEEFNSFVHKVRESIGFTKITGILDIFPSLKCLPGDMFKAKKLAQNATETREFCQHLIDECKKNPGKTNGVIDHFLQKQKQFGDGQDNPFTGRSSLSLC